MANPHSALVLHMRGVCLGNVEPGRRHSRPHRLGSKAHATSKVSLGYEITAGQNAVGDPATVLQFDQHVIHGVSSNRFAPERELAADEHDPVYGPEVPPCVT